MRDTRSNLIPSDTSPKANAVYFQRLAEMTPSERVRIGMGLWEAANSLQRAAILREKPDASEDDIRFEIAVRRFGAELARAAYGRS